MIFNDLPTESFKKFKESISEMGIITPLIVRPNGDAYQVIVGHQRLRACRDLGKEEVPCIIRENLQDDDMAIETLIEENIQRRTITPAEMMKAIARLYEVRGVRRGGDRSKVTDGNFGSEREEIAKIVGKSPKETSRFKTIHDNLSPEWISVFDSEDNKLSIDNAYALSQLDETIQTQIYKVVFEKGKEFSKLELKEEIDKAKNKTKEIAMDYKKAKDENEDEIQKLTDELSKLKDTLTQYENGSKNTEVIVNKDTSEKEDEIIELQSELTKLQDILRQRENDFKESASIVEKVTADKDNEISELQSKLTQLEDSLKQSENSKKLENVVNEERSDEVQTVNIESTKTSTHVIELFFDLYDKVNSDQDEEILEIINEHLNERGYYKKEDTQ